MKQEYTEEELVQLAYKIASSLKGGEVIELVGDVGAGKTTFTKALATALGVKETVQSPTFTISNRYETANGRTLAHYDFYRLHDAGIMADELAETANDNGCITVLEWSDIVAEVLPEDRLTLTLTPLSEEKRSVTFHAGGKISKKILEQLG